jgi:glycosyltransferase involved in cell wall biosynthesis
MDHLVQRLRNHSERGKRLIWHENASDQGLRELYERASGLLMASEGEGFGLPLVEIARYGKPILVRDIPVFREIIGVHAQYFASNSPQKLAMELQEWISTCGGVIVPGN